MTLEEAKQLKPGDLVLAEVKIKATYKGCISLSSQYVEFCDIREKIAPPRRRFKEGDLVKFLGDLSIIEVNRDELEGNLVFAGGFTKPFLFAELILVCAVEDRADRKGGEV